MSGPEGEAVTAVGSAAPCTIPEVGRPGPWSLLRAVFSPAFPCPGPHARAVYLALWLHADADGGSCFPSLARIAEKVGLTSRVVPRYLRSLEAAGLISRCMISGRVTNYRLRRVPSLDLKTDSEPNQPGRAIPGYQGEVFPGTREGSSLPQGRFFPTPGRNLPGTTEDSSHDLTEYLTQDLAEGPTGIQPTAVDRKSSARAGTRRQQGNPDVTRLIRHYGAEFERTQGVAPVIRWEVAGKAAQQLLAGRAFDGIGGAAWVVSAFLDDPPEWNLRKGLLRLEDVPAAATAVLQRVRQGGSTAVRRDSSGAPVAAAVVETEDVVEDGWWVRVRRDPKTGEVVSRRRRYPVEEGGTKHGQHTN